MFIEIWEIKNFEKKFAEFQWSQPIYFQLFSFLSNAKRFASLEWCRRSSAKKYCDKLVCHPKVDAILVFLFFLRCFLHLQCQQWRKRQRVKLIMTDFGENLRFPNNIRTSCAWYYHRNPFFFTFSINIQHKHFHSLRTDANPMLLVTTIALSSMRCNLFLSAWLMCKMVDFFFRYGRKKKPFRDIRSTTFFIGLLGSAV